MYPQRASDLLRGGGEGFRLFKPRDGLRDAVFNQLPRIGRLRVAEDEDRHFHARPAQLQRLVQAGDRQVIRTRLFQQQRRLNRAVTVGVGLHHAEEAAGLRECRADRPVIVQNVFHADFGPAAFIRNSHLNHLKCICAKRRMDAGYYRCIGSRSLSCSHARRRLSGVRRRIKSFPVLFSTKLRNSPSRSPSASLGMR